MERSHQLPSNKDLNSTQSSHWWLNNAIVRQLMGSSSIPASDLNEGSALALRELLFRISSLLASIAPVIMAFHYIIIQDRMLSLIYSILSCFMVVHSILLFSTNARLISPLTLLLMSLALYVGAMFWGQDYFIYWGFSFTGSFYLFLEKKQASPAMLFVVTVVSITAFFKLPPVRAIHFSGCMLLSLFFMELLCSMLYRQEERLRDLATTDPSTHAFNRRVLMDALEQGVTLFTRLGTPSAVVVIEVDGIRDFRESHGAYEAENALINLVAILKGLISESDKICHASGEELAVVLTGNSLAEARKIAESFREGAGKGNISKSQAFSLSCGIAEIHLGDSAQSWLSRGIEALYTAQANGGDQIAVQG